MGVIGRTGRRAFQRLKIIVISPTTVTPIATEPDVPAPTGSAGMPIGLLLTLTQA